MKEVGIDISPQRSRMTIVAVTFYIAGKLRQDLIEVRLAP